MKRMLSAFIALFMLVASVPVSLSADNVEYIGNIQLGIANSYSDALTCAMVDDFEVNLNKDLNDGISTSALFIGEKLTSNPKEAIRDLLVFSGDEYADKKTITTEKGITYYKVGGYVYVIDYNSDGDVIGKHIEWNDNINLNVYTSNDNIYLYATRDPRAGKPICSLEYTYQLGNTGINIKYVLDDSETVANWNQGNSGKSIYICMIFNENYNDEDLSFVPFSNDNPSGHIEDSLIASAFSSESIPIILISISILLIVFVVLLFLSRKGRRSTSVKL